MVSKLARLLFGRYLCISVANGPANVCANFSLIIIYIENIRHKLQFKTYDFKFSSQIILRFSWQSYVRRNLQITTWNKSFTNNTNHLRILRSYLCNNYVGHFYYLSSSLESFRNLKIIELNFVWIELKNKICEGET